MPSSQNLRWRGAGMKTFLGFLLRPGGCKEVCNAIKHAAIPPAEEWAEAQFHHRAGMGVARQSIEQFHQGIGAVGKEKTTFCISAGTSPALRAGLKGAGVNYPTHTTHRVSVIFLRPLGENASNDLVYRPDVYAKGGLVVAARVVWLERALLSSRLRE